LTNCWQLGLADAKLNREVEPADELLVELNSVEDETDELGIALARALFDREDELKPVSVMMWYRIIEWIGDLADYAEKVGDHLRLLIAMLAALLPAAIWLMIESWGDWAVSAVMTAIGVEVIQAQRQTPPKRGFQNQRLVAFSIFNIPEISSDQQLFLNAGNDPRLPTPPWTGLDVDGQHALGAFVCIRDCSSFPPTGACCSCCILS